MTTTTDYVKEKIQEFREMYEGANVSTISSGSMDSMCEWLAHALEQQRDEIVEEIEKEPIPLVRYVCPADDCIRHKTGNYCNNLSEPVEVTVRKLSTQEDSSNSTLSPLKEGLPDIHPNACECRVCKKGQDE